LLEQAREKLRAMHYSYRTEQTYLDWMKRYILFHGKRHPREMGAQEIEAFVSHLANDRGVSASTQTQALSAVLYLYRHVLGSEVGWIEGISRAKKSQRVPIVLTREEVAAVLARLEGRERLMAALMYGTGLRVMECVQLRVQSIDFGYRQITVLNGKGAKERFVPLPEALIPELKQCIVESERLLTSDKADGFGEVSMPESLVRKTPSAPFDLRWWYVFPSSQRSRDPRTGRIKRHHIDPSVLQKSMRAAVLAARIGKRATPHTLRHYAAFRIMPNHGVSCGGALARRRRACGIIIGSSGRLAARRPGGSVLVRHQYWRSWQAPALSSACRRGGRFAWSPAIHGPATRR